MDRETSIPITAPPSCCRSQWFVTREVNDHDEMESFFIFYLFFNFNVLIMQRSLVGSETAMRGRDCCTNVLDRSRGGGGNTQALLLEK